MSIQEFADRYRVHVHRDSCGDLIIPGKPRKAKYLEDRCHIYVHDDHTFGLALTFASARSWGNARRRLPVGFQLHRDGDTEGNFLFDPTNPEFAEIALKEAGVRRMSDAQLEQRRLAGLFYRFTGRRAEGD